MPGGARRSSTSLLGGKYLDVPENKWSTNIKKADIFFQDIWCFLFNLDLDQPYTHGLLQQPLA